MFDKYFEVFLADTHESRQIHYSIRYQVYCEEMGFENKEDFPSELESDDYDNQSTHFIVRDKLTGQWVGAMRLIFKNESSLPIEKNCKIYENIVNNDFCQAVELSRLCLIKEARRRFNDAVPPHGIVVESKKGSEKIKLIHNQQKINRTIIWGLIYAAAEYCYLNNIQNWYFMTTSALAKLLQRGGLNLTRIGQPCQHKGERFPFKMNSMETYHSEIWQNGYKNGYRLFSDYKTNQLKAYK